MTNDQRRAIEQLDRALIDATKVGALDLLQPACASPDSLNDVCDAVVRAVNTELRADGTRED